MLWSLVRILRVGLAQTDTEIAEEYANHRYAVSSHCTIRRRMCARINGPGDFDLLTLKLVCESHQSWGTFLPN